jgi:DNA repair protein RecO (recombination protein O)
MIIKTRAIVLHPVKYGESSLIVTLYSEKHGRLSVIVSGVHSKKTRLPATFFQPLTLLEADIYLKKNREVHRLKEVSTISHYTSIPFSVTKSAVALFLADVLLHTLREEEQNLHLFDFLFHAFQLLDSKDEGVSNFHLLFLLHYSRFLGIFPGETVESQPGLFSDPVLARIPPEAASILKDLLKLSLSQAENVSMSPAIRHMLLDSLIRYFEQHLEGMGRIRSASVLSDLFRDST